MRKIRNKTDDIVLDTITDLLENDRMSGRHSSMYLRPLAQMVIMSL